MTTAVILAGGLGTRLRSVVDDRPKPMAEVAGRPLLEHLMSYWIKQGVERLALSVGYKGTMIQEHFGHSYEGISVDYVQEPAPLGTGGALISCIRQLRLDAPFLLLNGDTYFEVNLHSLISLGKKTEADWVFGLFPTKDERRYLAVDVENDGRLAMSRNPQGSNEVGGQRWANGGVYWINPRSLAPLISTKHKASLESDFLPYLYHLKQVFYGLKCNGTFVDIGVPEDYLRAQTMSCFK